MSTSLTLSVKCSNDQKYSITCTSTTTIPELKELIAKESGIDSTAQRLIYAGRVLKDDGGNVESYGIKDGHTIHLVKSSSTATATATSASTTTPASATPQTAPAPTTPAAPVTPATQPTANPFGSMFGMMPPSNTANPFGGVSGMNFPSSAGGMDEQLLANPELMRASLAMLQANPQLLETVINSNPQLASLPPEMRQMLMSPEMMRMMLDPNVTATLQQMRQTGGTLPGAAGAGTGFGGWPQMDLSGMMAGMGAATVPQQNTTPVSTEPPEIRFQAQLAQLQDMGFYDASQNIRALLATGGNVHAAVEYILTNG